ncbi:MAG TPA: thioredoxin-disulfide reductase, partial [Thermoanaerobaculia bacterium]|nr:thioredoxin-disulfide reductase [Thermoanaerobaculia bacterium]
MPARNHYRVAIIGSGPAGLTAAIYAARANLAPLVLEGIQPGGQLTTTTDVENFPGFAHGIQGPALMDVTRKQAERFGAEIVADTVLDVDVKAEPFGLVLEAGGRVTADAVIVASGASAKYLGLESEKKLLGYGVSACATCDGFFFRGKEVVVVGGGDTAMEEATFLTKFCTKVHLVHRRDAFRASKIMAQRALANPKIEVLLDTVVQEILGEPGAGVTGVRVKNTKTGEAKTLAVSGYFAAIGHQPNTAIFAGKLEMNEVGYLKIAHPTTKTSVEGIFAAGDVADFLYRQAISAAGEGCKAAIDAERWLGARGIH